MVKEQYHYYIKTLSQKIKEKFQRGYKQRNEQLIQKRTLVVNKHGKNSLVNYRHKWLRFRDVCDQPENNFLFHKATYKNLQNYEKIKYTCHKILKFV